MVTKKRNVVLSSASCIAGMGLAVLATATTAHAHLRWFADAEKYGDQHYAMDLTNILVVVGALLFVAIAFYVSRAGWAHGISAKLERISRSHMGILWRLVAFLTGLMLIVFTIKGMFLAPNIELPNETLKYIGLAGQLILGLLLLLQISFSITGVLILVVVVLTAIVVPLNVLVDYVFEFVALALALVFIGPTLCALDRRVFKRAKRDPEQYAHLPVPIIRVGVGITLVVLAIHNKLLNPGLTLAFLDEYHFNFMPSLGFSNFTNLHFAFGAGIAELTLGLLLLAGLATRFVTTVLSLFFVLTIVLIGPIELIGHAPLIGIAVLLIVCGSGRYRLVPRGRTAQEPITDVGAQRVVSQP